MRVLHFIVDGLIMKPDPDCDFSGLIPGTEGYLQATFQFSQEWNGCVKVVGFWKQDGTECPPQPLLNGRSCIIPAEALTCRQFRMQVLGKDGSLKLKTNKVTIKQNGGKS